MLLCICSRDAVLLEIWSFVACPSRELAVEHSAFLLCCRTPIHSLQLASLPFLFDRSIKFFSLNIGACVGLADVVIYFCFK